MFCPNCGTQNPDAAQTCSKCSFHLKSAAAPKFKGTMLMMNQPGSLFTPRPPTPAAAVPPNPSAVGVPPPPGARAGQSRLKGTMVGVAPMAGGLPPIAPMAPSPLATPMSPSQPPEKSFKGEGASAFSPPVPQPGGVNPLGGTLVADAGAFGAYAVQQQGTQMNAGAAAGTPPRYGAQAPTAPAFGVEPPPGMPGAAPYGAAPLQAHGDVEPFGQPQPPHGHGQPMPMQQVGQGMATPAYGQPQGAPMLGTLKSQGAQVAKPTRRNALLTFLLPLAIMFGGLILSIVLALVVTPALAALGSLFILGGAVFYLLLAVQMIHELKSITRSSELAWWPLIVPIYQMYFMWILVPQEVAKAKQMLGVRQPPQPVLLYIFLWHFALASDLNDMVR